MYAGIAVTTQAPKIPSFFEFKSIFLVSADSASSQTCPDSMRHLPDNTGVWSAFVLAGMTADAVEDAETSSYEKRSVCCCSHGMTRSSLGCSVCLGAPASGVFSASRVTSLVASMTLPGIFRRRPILLFISTALWSSMCPHACLTVSIRVTTEPCY